MDTLVIGSWVSLHDGCDISGDVGGSDAAMLTVRGTGGQPFELHFQAETLRQFVAVAAQTLAAMDALAIQEGADRAARERANQQAEVHP